MSVYGRYTRSTHVNLPADNSHGYIRLTQHCFKGVVMVVLRCRLETYNGHVKCFIECRVFQGLLAEIVCLGGYSI